MLYLLLTLYCFQAQENPHYEGWLIIKSYAGDCPDAYESLGAMAWLTGKGKQTSGYVYFDDGSIARVEGERLIFPAAVGVEPESYQMAWQQDEGSFKIDLTLERTGQEPCAWSQSFLRLKPTETPGPSQQEWLNEYQVMTIMAEVDHDVAQGITTDALARLRQALVLSPYNEGIHNSFASAVGKSEDRTSLSQSFFENATKVSETQPELACAYRAVLGCLLNFSGDREYEAKNYENALETYQKALELNPNNHRVLSNIGATCFSLKHENEAVVWYQKAMTSATTEIQIKFKPKTITQVALIRYFTRISELLETTPDWSKNKTQAASELPDTPMIKQALEKWEAINNQMLRNLWAGQYTSGLNLAKEALTLAEKYFGETHPQYFTSLNNMAIFYVRQGAYQKAQPLLERALQLSRDVLGERHPDTLNSLLNLAMLYLSQGVYQQAQHLFERALQLSLDVLGERHPFTLALINNLAALYQRQGEFQKAQPLFARALQLRRDVLGELHPETLSSMINLAGLYERQGAYQKAHPLYERALQLHCEVLGERQPDTLASLSHLARCESKSLSTLLSSLFCRE